MNAYDDERTTLYSDFPVEDETVTRWRRFGEHRGYKCIHTTEAFSQFRRADDTPRYPVDFMIVGKKTFEKLWDRRLERNVVDALLGVPDPLHLIALKLHARENEVRFLQGKDLPDMPG